MSSRLSPSRWVGPVQGIALTLAWLGIWGVGHLAEFTLHASVWYPPSALTFAALVVVGYRAVPYLFVASFLATPWSVVLYGVEASTADIVGGGLAYSAAHIGLYGAGAAALRWLATRRYHSLPMIVIGFLVISTLASAATTVAVLFGLVWFNLMAPSAVAATWLAFWIGDFVAIIVLAPLFGALFLKLYRNPEFWIAPLKIVRQDRLTLSFGYKLAVNLLWVSVAIWVAARAQTLESVFLIFFLLIPQMWLTQTESPFRTAVSLAAVSFLIVIWLSVVDLSEYTFVYQFAIAIVATTAYFGLAIPLLVSDNQQLRQRVMFDPLTGATSRHGLLRQAEFELQRAHRRTGCLAAIDLDHFKQVNDRFGHATGDRVLVALTQTLRDHTRGTDIVARFGGDEFIVMFADTDLELARDLLESARRAVHQLDVIEGHQLTISIGLTDLAPEEGFDVWFQRADNALYDAKQAGRDRLCVRPVGANTVPNEASMHRTRDEPT